MLSEFQVEKFQKLYKKHFGVEISRKDAYAKGISLVRAMELVYRPMTKEEYEQLQKRRKESN